MQLRPSISSQAVPPGLEGVARVEVQLSVSDGEAMPQNDLLTTHTHLSVPVLSVRGPLQFWKWSVEHLGETWNSGAVLSWLPPTEHEQREESLLLPRCLRRPCCPSVHFARARRSAASRCLMLQARSLYLVICRMAF